MGAEKDLGCDSPGELPLQLTVIVVASDACIEAAAVVVASVVQFAFDGLGDSELAEIG